MEALVPPGGYWMVRRAVPRCHAELDQPLNPNLCDRCRPGLPLSKEHNLGLAIALECCPHRITTV